jgi:hypothetical protein
MRKGWRKPNPEAYKSAQRSRNICQWVLRKNSVDLASPNRTMRYQFSVFVQFYFVKASDFHGWFIDTALTGFDVTYCGGSSTRVSGEYVARIEHEDSDTVRASLILVTSHQTTYKWCRNPADHNDFVELWVFLYTCIAHISPSSARWTVRLWSRQSGIQPTFVQHFGQFTARWARLFDCCGTVPWFNTTNNRECIVKLRNTLKGKRQDFHSFLYVILSFNLITFDFLWRNIPNLA